MLASFVQTSTITLNGRRCAPVSAYPPSLLENPGNGFEQSLIFPSV